MIEKPIIRPRKYFKSEIEQAVHEVELALLDYRYAGKTTKAQLKRAMIAMGRLYSYVNCCHFGHYEMIESMDKSGWLQKAIGAPPEYYGNEEEQNGVKRNDY